MGKKRIRREMRASRLYFKYRIKQERITKEHLSNLLKNFSWKNGQLKNEPIIAQTNDEVQVLLEFNKPIYLNDINRLSLTSKDTSQENSISLVEEDALLEYSKVFLPIPVHNCKSATKIFEWIAENDATYSGIDPKKMQLIIEKLRKRWPKAKRMKLKAYQGKKGMKYLNENDLLELFGMQAKPQGLTLPTSCEKLIVLDNPQEKITDLLHFPALLPTGQLYPINILQQRQLIETQTKPVEELVQSNK